MRMAEARGCPASDPEHDCKAMDRIDDEKIEEIVERSLFAAKDLLMGPPPAIFRDVTTLRSESEFEGELRSKGTARTARPIGSGYCAPCR